MDKYKRYYGVIIFGVAVLLLFFLAYKIVVPRYVESQELKVQLDDETQKVESLKSKLATVQKRIERIKNSINTSQKKIYSPVEVYSTGDRDETIFFTLYNDVIEMLHANSIKIRSITPAYNPESDAFVKFGKDSYFVCDIDLELVSNYVNLGKFIQDIYQYPYYIRINSLEVTPYTKDKKILLSSLSLRLYAHTTPEEIVNTDTSSTVPDIDGAKTPLPRE